MGFKILQTNGSATLEPVGGETVLFDRPRLIVFLCAVAIIASITAQTQAGIEHSVVRIVNYSQRGDWSSPWSASQATEVSGSGFVIEGGLVMTNAHVVSDSRLLLLYVYGDPNPHQAEIVHIAHDCDLALIRSAESGRLSGVPPLVFGSRPELGSAVDTLGYPAGGIQVSSTRGVVSRIDEMLYVHSDKDTHVVVQTDAAINPGASGGPVIQNGRVVGVAFQANFELENTGFVIPIEVIARFLRDVEDGRYDGYPELGIGTANLEQPSARARAGMAHDESGVQVHLVYRGSSADGNIEVGDIVLAVNGHPVANDGSVADNQGRVSFGMLIDRMFIGDTATIRVLRAGKRIDVDVPLSRYPQADAYGNVYDEWPRYFVYGGLVFVELCQETLKTYGADWPRDAPKTLLDEFLYRPLVEPDLQLHNRVVLLRRLDHSVNVEMAWYRNQVVERVNGQIITDLEVLVNALEGHDGDYHLLEFAHGRRFSVLDRRRAEAANAEILRRYGIQKDRNL